jgi:hypothetical protein
VEWGASPFSEHDLEHLSERAVADEERERLVLVRRQRVKAEEQKRAESDRNCPDSERVAVGRERASSALCGRWHSLLASAGGPRSPC